MPSTDVIQLNLTLKMTTTQVVETSVTVNNNSRSNSTYFFLNSSYSVMSLMFT